MSELVLFMISEKKELVQFSTFKRAIFLIHTMYLIIY